MEFIFELLFEIIVEGSIELSTHKKVPMPLRVLAFILCFGVFGLIGAIFFMLGFDYVDQNNIGGAVFFFILGALFVIAFIYGINRTYRENNKPDNDTDDDTPSFGEAKPSGNGLIIIATIAAIGFVIIGAYILYTYELF